MRGELHRATSVRPLRQGARIEVGEEIARRRSSGDRGSSAAAGWSDPM
jgi:hypothetical protein